MKACDPDQPTKYIIDLDAKILYGWAMSKPLPTHRLEWMSDSELKNWRNHPSILEVVLKYSKELHNLHNDYPLASERLKIGNVEKLIPNLWDKSNTSYIMKHWNYMKVSVLKSLRFTEESNSKKVLVWNHTSI